MRDTGGTAVEIMVIRTRVLAEAPSRVWIAVSGTLGAATAPRLRQKLRACDDGKRSEFFLDMRELRYEGELPADVLRELFALGTEGRFHLIGAPSEIHACFAGDPRFTPHSRLESAWKMWM
ncbi:hypothetical protein [Streptomyces sp. NPDC002845]